MKDSDRPVSREQQKAANRRTALWLAALALAFFIGIVVRQLWLS